jgi:L-rhamnonate dehydratase
VKINGLRLRDLGFSREPATLKSHTVSSVALFDDAHTRPGGWFGDTLCTLVEVFTDTGHVGLGTSGAFHGGGKELIRRYYAELVLGEDPRLHEWLWQRMYRTNLRFGRSGSGMAALSALDIACWDVHGQHDRVPVAALLGGITQTQMPCYASRLYAYEDLDELAREAHRWVDAGFTRLKQRFGFGPRDGIAGMNNNERLVKTVRDAVGFDVELAGEAYMGWDRGYALQMAERLRPYHLSWLEEPVPAFDLTSYTELSRRLPWQRWSAGEHLYTKWEFLPYLRDGVIDICQPDANRVGGITELVKICNLAEAFGVPVVPHSNEAHNLHVSFSRSSAVCPVVEYFPDTEPDTGNELFWKVFDGNAVAKKGHLRLSEEAGLGLRLNEEVVARIQVGEPVCLGDVPTNE